MSDETSERGRGRPEHEPDRRTRATVQVMHANGIPHRIIAKTIGCDGKTLRKYYHEELRDAGLQVEAAMGAAIVSAARNGAWSAAKYWLMTHSKDARWRTPEPHSISGDPDAPPIRLELTDMSHDDIRSELAALDRRAEALAQARTMGAAVSRKSNGVGH